MVQRQRHRHCQQAQSVLRKELLDAVTDRVDEFMRNDPQVSRVLKLLVEHMELGTELEGSSHEGLTEAQMELRLQLEEQAVCALLGQVIATSLALL